MSLERIKFHPDASISDASAESKFPLLDSQRRFKTISDKLLELKPHGRLSFFSLETPADPNEIWQLITKSSLSDMLLKEGESLSDIHTPEAQLTMSVDLSYLTAITITHWDWDTREPQYDWLRQLDINFLYEHGKEHATQTLTLSTNSIEAGYIPTLQRSVRSPLYRDFGYEGHTFAERPFHSEEEVEMFMDLVMLILGEKFKL